VARNSSKDGVLVLIANCDLTIDQERAGIATQCWRGSDKIVFTALLALWGAMAGAAAAYGRASSQQPPALSSRPWILPPPTRHAEEAIRKLPLFRERAW
jgi:hypothetical protein